MVKNKFYLEFRYDQWNTRLQRKIIRKGVETWINATDKQVLQFINQNYISKEQIVNLECLKEEDINLPMTEDNIDVCRKRGFRNQLRKEIKEEIEKL